MNMKKSLILGIAAIAIAAFACSTNRAEEKEHAVKPTDKKPKAEVDPDAPGVDPEKIDWEKVDWRRRLSRLQYHITREAGTERPFTGKYWKLFDAGKYNCSNCGLPLFESTTKFDAGCGWPSFDQTIDKKAVVEIEDNSLGMRRIEVRCRRCDAHLGHVFDDGPTETGLRYCMNSASLDFVPEKAALTKRKPASHAAKAKKPAATKSTETPAEKP
jgi:peptide-methionine (R)-S-oxide reductase